MFYRYIIIFIGVAILMYLWYIPQYEHMTNRKDDPYKEFYDMLSSASIAKEDKCRLCKIKIQDAEDGLKVDGATLQAAKDFLEDHCNPSRPPKIVKDEQRKDIDPKKNDSLEKTYRNYCMPKFGEIRDRIAFDKYVIETDENGDYMLNGTVIDKVKINLENCRRLEEYIKNKANEKNDQLLSIDQLYDQCLVEHKEIGRCKKGGYNYYLSRDGKYYLNNEPLDRVRLTRQNCEIINDIKKTDEETSGDDTPALTLKMIEDAQREKLCKKSAEYDYICRVYDKDKIFEYGKAHDKQPQIYQYLTGPDETRDFEYSYLTPTEFIKVNKNIKNGKSGLMVDNEIDLCYRKFMIDRECDALYSRKS